MEKIKYQLVPPQPRIKNILVVEDDIIDIQINYTPEGAAKAIDAILKNYHTAHNILDMFSEPGDPISEKLRPGRSKTYWTMNPTKCKTQKKYLFRALKAWPELAPVREFKGLDCIPKEKWLLFTFGE